MIVHFCLYWLCRRSCVYFEKKKAFCFWTLYHLNVLNALVLQFAQACLLISPNFEKVPETQQGWGGGSFTITDWFVAAL